MGFTKAYLYDGKKGFIFDRKNSVNLWVTGIDAYQTPNPNIEDIAIGYADDRSFLPVEEFRDVKYLLPLDLHVRFLGNFNYNNVCFNSDGTLIIMNTNLIPPPVIYRVIAEDLEKEFGTAIVTPVKIGPLLARFANIVRFLDRRTNKEIVGELMRGFNRISKIRLEELSKSEKQLLVEESKMLRVLERTLEDDWSDA
jgi:hypothetical protein